ncbi:hypothetical protein CYMTET_39361 [Cymbomonas tetramitiformis]|uniref:DUF7869 domain-containing protein n=1 Tax=Cymbomonas tetramitiformis TaxID=36881 RepID=A0AAE0F4Q9_9CHLO|nr:hypothetical protein CYMTET_39361 [Cymbomonas tetramitiformis]
MALLVHYDIYEKIELHRLMVGHTHNDVDGWFGLMKMQVFGKDATKAGKWLITLEEYIDWINGWTIKKFDKDVYVQGSQLDFKAWMHDHVNWSLTGYAGLERAVHFLHFQKDDDSVVRMKYKNGVHMKTFMPTGVDNDSRKGLIVKKSYPELTSSPELAPVKPLEDEKDTLAAFERMRDHADYRITHEQQETLLKYFPLPKSNADYETWNGPRPDVQAPLDLQLIQNRAWHEAPVETHPYVGPVQEQQVETIADGINVRVKDLPIQEAAKLQGVVHRPKVVGAGAQEAAKLQGVVHLAKVLGAGVQQKVELQRRLRAKAKQRGPSKGSGSQRRLFSGKRVQLTPATSPGADPGTQSPQAHELNSLAKEVEKGVAANNSEDTDSDADLPLALRRAKYQPQPQDSDSSSEDDTPLACRFLPTDYTFEMLDPGCFAVTAAGEADAADQCSFTFKISQRQRSPPLHFVEVLEVDKAKKLVHWQFWLPCAHHLISNSKRTSRTYKSVDILFQADAFRRGNSKLRAWHPFDADEVVTCWDAGAKAPTGAIPTGDEKTELLKVATDNAE